MKNFFILLAKGVGIALIISLSVCFFFWFWGNWRAIAWYVMGLFFAWLLYKYFNTPLLDGKFTDLFVGAVCLLAFFTCLYGIGRLGEWLFDYHADYFELTIFHGFVLLLLCVIAYFSVCALRYARKELDRQYLISLISEVIQWILIIGISVAVGAAVLYYCLPLIF